MTRDEIIAKWNAMTSRDRDAWVAEVVLGYEQRIYYDSGRVEWHAANSEPLTKLPSYTADTAAMWAIIDALNPMYITLTRRQDGGWYFTIHPLNLLVDQPSAPEAVGLAALIAKLAA